MKAYIAVTAAIFLMDSALLMARSLGWVPEPYSSNSLIFAVFANLAIGIWGLTLLVRGVQP
jgi:hypothetical protein